MNKMSSSMLWRTLQQYSVYAVKLLVQIVLARILVPEEYGIIAIVSVFINIAEIISTSGLGTALVQKKDPNKDDYATVFTTSLVFSLILYIIIFLTAGMIGNFYNNPKLIPVLRVYCLILFPQSYLTVINAYVQKQFEFKKSCFGCFIAIVIAGIISIIAALSGAGVWALVICSIMTSVLSAVIIQLLLSWRPRFGFSKEVFVKLFSFSWKVLASSLIGVLLEDIYNLTIGKYYGDSTLGYYKQGNSYPSAIIGQTRIALSSVMFPIYASLQDAKDQLIVSIRRMTRLMCFIIFPMACGLAAISDTFICVILTEKWLPAAYYLRLECIFFGSLAITTSLGNGITAIGRSDISMKIELAKLFSTILCVLAFNSYGVKVICIARIIVALFFVIVYSVVSNKVLHIRNIDILDSSLTPLILSVVMGVICYFASYIPLSSVLVLIIQIVLGVFVYGIGAIMFMKNDVNQIRNIVKGIKQ